MKRLGQITVRACVVAAACLAWPFLTPMQAADAPYAGSEACQVCHEDLSKSFAKNPHHAIETDAKRGWKDRGCESCHGPGAKHAESASPADIKAPAKMAADAANALCLNCHRNESTPAGRIETGHARNTVACTSCHSIHGANGHSLVPRIASAVNAQCAACHKDAWSQFQKPFHHRLPEGAMSCVDCHNPHSRQRPAARQTILVGREPSCVNCHTDKRGPFAFEHAPVRFEGCGSCHETHGSANPRMLTRHEVRLVCLECHSNLPVTRTSNPTLGVVPPAFHDLNSPVYRNCTVCHQKVHGSHADRNLLR